MYVKRQDRLEVNRVSISNAELLCISDGGHIYYGAHQLWYPSWWKRMSGCGPTTASNLMWYSAQTRQESCGALCEKLVANRTDMLLLMEEVWRYITPGFRGVNSASIFTEGAIRFSKDRGVLLQASVLDVPERKEDRPDQKKVYGFLTAAFSDNLPVAFLNLSNGDVRNLDNWHWVTLVSTDQALQAEMYDQGRRQMVDVGRWIDTTRSGGAFVALKPDF